MAISGTGVATVAAGAVLIYAGLTKKTPVQALRDALSGTVTPVPSSTATIPGTNGSTSSAISGGTAVGNLLANAAVKYVGRPYQWARNFDGPNGGGDCSGLVYRAYHDIGVNAPRLNALGFSMWRTRRVQGTPAPGDLLWWPGHIAICIGDGKMVEAPTFGVPVRVVPIRPGYLAVRYNPPATPTRGRTAI